MGHFLPTDFFKSIPSEKLLWYNEINDKFQFNDELGKAKNRKLQSQEG